MKRFNSACLALFALAAPVLVAAQDLSGLLKPDIGQIIKLVGVPAFVDQFGSTINDQINGLTGHHDSSSSATKVVTIVSVGVNSRKAIGFAQVTGSARNVAKVKAVASPEIDVRQLNVVVRALVPVATDSPDVKNLKPVDGVGVSGLVDIKL